jgi:hypothetical protein
MLLLQIYLHVLQTQQANIEIETAAGRASIGNTSLG